MAMTLRSVRLGDDAILTDGSQGQLVRQLQEMLAGLGFSPGKIDGIYGPETKAAVIRLQNAKGVSPDGIVGPQTWVALRGPTPMVAAPQPQAAPILAQPSFLERNSPYLIAGAGAMILLLLLGRRR